MKIILVAYPLNFIEVSGLNQKRRIAAGSELYEKNACGR